MHFKDIGLSISSKKTKILAVLPDDSYQKLEPLLLHTDDILVGVVFSFQYLGSIVQENLPQVLRLTPGLLRHLGLFHQLSHDLWYK